jgi:hypothetical protein
VKLAGVREGHTTEMMGYDSHVRRYLRIAATDASHDGERLVGER